MKYIFPTIALFAFASFIRVTAQNISPLWVAPIKDWAAGIELINDQTYLFCLSGDETHSYLLKVDQDGVKTDSIQLPEMEILLCSHFSKSDSSVVLGGYSFGYDTLIVGKCDLNGNMLWLKKLTMPGFEKLIPRTVSQNTEGRIAVSFDKWSFVNSVFKVGYLLLENSGEVLVNAELDGLATNNLRSMPNSAFFNDTTLILQNVNEDIGLEVHSINLPTGKINWTYEHPGLNTMFRMPLTLNVLRDRCIVSGGTYGSLVRLDSLGQEISNFVLNDNPNDLSITRLVQEREFDLLEVSCAQLDFSASGGQIYLNSLNKDCTKRNWKEYYDFQGIEKIPQVGSAAMPSDTVLFIFMANLTESGNYLAKFQLPPSKLSTLSSGPVPPFPASISPNPTVDGRIWIRSQEWPAQVEVVDATGRAVFCEMAENDIEIQLPTGGFYTVRISDRQRTGSMKVLFVH